MEEEMINSINPAKCYDDNSLLSGIYVHRCPDCREMYTGYKRRYLCRECDAAKPKEPTEDEKAAIWQALTDAFKRFDNEVE